VGRPFSRTASVEIGTRAVEVSTVALGLDGPPVEAGAWLVVHTGLAVERLNEEDARRILGARAELGAEREPPEPRERPRRPQRPERRDREERP